MTTEIDEAKAKTQVDQTLEWATRTTVDNSHLWREARELRAGIKKLDDELDEHFKKMKRPWDEGKQKILDEEKRLRDPTLTALKRLDQKILEFENKFFQYRRDQERKLQEAERQRAIDERTADALEMERNGHPDEAKALLAQPLRYAPIVLPEFDDWLDGEGRQDYYSAEVIDLKTLVDAVAAGKQPLSLLQPDMTTLNKMARALKETMAIPGVTAKKRTGIVQR